MISIKLVFYQKEIQGFKRTQQHLWFKNELMVPLTQFTNFKFS